MSGMVQGDGEKLGESMENGMGRVPGLVLGHSQRTVMAVMMVLRRQGGTAGL